MSESHKYPFQGLVDVASEMNRMRRLGRYGYDPGGEERKRTHATAWVPTADIFARGRDLVIQVELAGVAPQDIDLKFQESVLTISGERYVLSENGNESFCRYAAPSVGRYELHERRWRLIRDLFPPPKAAGRRRRDPRQMLDAILWILSGGAPWRDLPERYGPWQSAYHRYRIWTNDGTFGRILERLQVRLNAEGLLDLDTWFVDSTIVRASRAAAGAKKGAVMRLWAAPVAASPRRCTWCATA